jgi:hypothetical protein
MESSGSEGWKVHVPLVEASAENSAAHGEKQVQQTKSQNGVGICRHVDSNVPACACVPKFL